MSKIIDEVTKELSEAIDIIWNQNTLKANLEKLKTNPQLGRIKEHLDNAQEMLSELLIYLEQFESKLALGFYMLDNG